MDYIEEQEYIEQNPILRVILQGVNDEESPLSKLRGTPELVDMIWHKVVEYWKNHIKLSSEEDMSLALITQCTYRHKLDHIRYETIAFPEPKNININMMPFIINDQFEETKLPENLKEYFDNILHYCIRSVKIDGEYGKVGYLTIQENFVDENTSQRRPGLHIDSPGTEVIDGCKQVLHWGCGTYYLEIEGGLFIASNIDESCAIWDCQIEHPKNGEPDVTGKLGDLEHIRDLLPQKILLPKNKIYWLTDRTPHESLPLKKRQYRQFFRFVTSKLSLWHEDHCTKNPLGVVPDPNITKVVKGSKFDGTTIIISQDESENRGTGNICIDFDMANNDFCKNAVKYFRKF